MGNTMSIVLTNASSENVTVYRKSPNKAFEKRVLVLWKSDCKEDAKKLLDRNKHTPKEARNEQVGDNHEKRKDVAAGETLELYYGRKRKTTIYILTHGYDNILMHGNKKLAQIKCCSEDVVYLTIKEFGVLKDVKTKSNPVKHYKFDSFNDKSMESNIMQNTAPKMKIEYSENNNEDGSIIMQDINIPKKGLADYTTYGVLMWNKKMDGHGHCGIQCRPHKRLSIYFTLYPPINAIESKINTESYEESCTVIEKYGKRNSTIILRSSQDWLRPDRWYTFAVRVWNKGNNRSGFGFWIFDYSSNSTTHIATFDYPANNICLEGKTCSFLQDIYGTENDRREVLLRNGYKFCKNGNWENLSHGDIKVVSNIRNSSVIAHNVEFDRHEIRLLSGGKTTDLLFGEECVQPKKFPYPFQLNSLTMKNITEQISSFFKLEYLRSSEIKWVVPDNVQFSYSITVEDETLITEETIDFGKRSYKDDCFKRYEGRNIILTMENIFGEKHSENVEIPRSRLT